MLFKSGKFRVLIAGADYENGNLCSYTKQNNWKIIMCNGLHTVFLECIL